jgi:carboxypeptidase family protein/photosynthesis system II assembly factor YCF48-like protein/putative zinc finger protein
MQNVPKIVRERLWAATPAVNHPDADVLTAFAERSLPSLERDVVLEHLARCGDCRDIVALALPATEPVETEMKPSPSGWLTWPALRWGFVAAGVVIIASVGILRYEAHSQHGTMSASNNAPAPQPAATEAKNQPLATPAPPPPSEKREKIQPPAASTYADSLMMDNAPVRDKKSPSRVEVPTVNAIQSPVGGAAGGGAGQFRGSLLHGPMSANQMTANQWQQNTEQNRAAAPVPSTAVGKEEAAGAFTADRQAQKANQAMDNQTMANQTAAERGAAAADLTTRAQNETTVLQYDAAAPQPAADDLRVRKDKPLALPAPGQIGGYVVDPTGAGVSSARVTIIPSTMGGTTTTITNSQGVWLIAGLPTGNYKVAAEAPGFATAVKDLHYDANQPKMYSFSLSPGSVSETVMVSAEAGQLQTENANIGGPITSGANAQIPVNGRNVTLMATLSPGGLQTFWSLNPAGRLQRSFDQGKTWLPVDVNANPALYAAVVAETSRAKAKDAEKARKAPVVLTFRALAVAGSDVWVGGSGGALYHSVDAGGHWTRVVPATSGTVLTNDIVSLEFSDPQHGKLSTSAGEAWTTADAGQTWQKQ